MTNSFELKFDMDNAAFDDENEPVEISRILQDIAKKVDHVIYIPQTHRLFTPLLSVIPQQLLAYHMAALRGCEIDQPRTLAKSVTVE